MKKVLLIVVVLLAVVALAGTNTNLLMHMGKVLLIGLGVGMLAIANLAVAILNMKWRNVAATIVNILLTLPLVFLTVSAFKWHVAAGIFMGWIALAHFVLIWKSVEHHGGQRQANDQLLHGLAEHAIV